MDVDIQMVRVGGRKRSQCREGNGNPHQYSCLENPRDRGAWWAVVYGLSQSRTQLKRLSSSSSRGLSECAHFRIEGQVWIENDQGRVCRVGENKQKGQSWGEKKQYLFHVRSLLQKYQRQGSLEVILNDSLHTLSSGLQQFMSLKIILSQGPWKSCQVISVTCDFPG